MTLPQSDRLHCFIPIITYWASNDEGLIRCVCEIQELAMCTESLTWLTSPMFVNIGSRKQKAQVDELVAFRLHNYTRRLNVSRWQTRCLIIVIRYITNQSLPMRVCICVRSCLGTSHLMLVRVFSKALQCNVAARFCCVWIQSDAIWTTARKNNVAGE